MNHYTPSMFSFLEKRIHYESAPLEDKRLFDEGFVLSADGFVYGISEHKRDGIVFSGEFGEDSHRVQYGVRPENISKVLPGLVHAHESKLRVEVQGLMQYKKRAHSFANRDGLVLLLERIIHPDTELIASGKSNGLISR